MNNILTSTENRVLTITINRPDKLNALTTATIQELHYTLHGAATDKNIGAIVITGSGEKAFVAGADITEFSNFTALQGEALSRNGHTLLFDFIENYNKPVIAAINGFALGGGLELALCCHIRIASNNAKMGFPELNLGVIPGYGGTQRLAQLVGKGKAMELILTTDMLTADEALKLNLVNHITTKEDLLLKAYEIAAKIISKSPRATATAIKAINANYNHALNGYEVEIVEFGKCFDTSDFKEGVGAFLEKRKPNFLGE